MAKARKKKQSLENQLLRLEEILDVLDTGEEEVEKMITLYEEGMHLVKDARSALENAEQRITTIRDSMNDSPARDDEFDTGIDDNALEEDSDE